MENFTVVSKKKSRRRIFNNKKTNVERNRDVLLSNSCPFGGEEFEVLDEQKIDQSIKSIEKTRNEIIISDFWADTKELLETKIILDRNTAAASKNIEEIVSYGIGNFASSPIARYQFAFLLLLVEYLEIEDKIYMYDPVLTNLERFIIERLNIHLIPRNEECRRTITKRTLVFMLHCGKKMYDNVLSANWNPGLENLVIVGNAFSNYIERIPSTTLCKESPYIFDIIPYIHEDRIKNSFEHKDIFNDTCIMTFPSELLSKVDEDFWAKERTVSSNEDDVEIITKEKVQEFLT